MPLKWPDCVRFGLIGCGAVSGKYLEAFAQLAGARLVAVADTNQERASEAAARCGGEAYTDHRYVLDRRDVDAIVIAAPSGLHAPLALEAMASGKHVLVEKPMALCVEDADRMIAAAATAGVVLAVALQYRFHWASCVLKSMVEEGRLGRVLWAAASVKWYRPQAYYSQGGWRGTLQMDGGVLLNQAIHHLDLLLWLAGPVDDVVGFRATLGHNVEAEDSAALAIRFACGALGTLEATTCAYPQNLEETVTIIGERGSVIMGGNSIDSFREWRVPGTPFPEPAGDHQRNNKWYPHCLLLKDVVAAIREKRQPLVDGLEGRRALEVIQRFRASNPLTRWATQ